VCLPAGMIGYSAYCPSKFAVRGLAESLRNEVRWQQLWVLLC
jgi:NAD(P)-dependent dehydrogenase (short-subunit alcohol dehydrogenase family)